MAFIGYLAAAYVDNTTTMVFADIPGLPHTKKLLTDGIDRQKIPHAQLFTGPEGALTLPLALAYAHYLHCESKGKACGVCDACRKSDKYIHPDTHFVFPISGVRKKDGNEERFRAETLQTWRAFLLDHPFGDADDWVRYHGGEKRQALISRQQGKEAIKTLWLKPFISAYRAVVVWQPERMHPAAANGMLKALEEPPPNTVFLLASDADEQLLPTVRSRLQTVRVPKLADSEIRTFLERAKRIEKERMDTVVQLADGALNRALKLVDTDKNPNLDWFAQWMRACFKRNYKELIATADAFHKADRLTQQNRLRYSGQLVREALLHLVEAAQIGRVSGEDIVFVKNFSRALSLMKVEKLNEALSQAAHRLSRNGSAKMIFLSLSLHCASILNPSRQ